MNWYKLANSASKLLYSGSSWYNPDSGHLVPVKEAHALEVIRNPSEFGITKEEIKDIMARHPAVLRESDANKKKTIMEKVLLDPEEYGLEEIKPLWEYVYNKGYLRVSSSQYDSTRMVIYATGNNKETMQKFVTELEPYMGKKIKRISVNLNSVDMDLDTLEKIRNFLKYGNISNKMLR